jgi:acyl CoA:acetate/3-ketoacid CoA transferase alpha subunit
LEDNLGAADIRLTAEELSELNEMTSPTLTYPHWFVDRVVDVPVKEALAKK